MKPLRQSVLLPLAALAVAAPSTPPEFTHRQADDYSRAWVESIERSKAGAGLVIIGVHTPELSAERSPSAVRHAVERLGIHYPVMIDGDSSYWNAHNQYWPTFYLIGRDGLLYGTVPGELHVGDERAKKVEAALDLLLKAPAT